MLLCSNVVKFVRREIGEIVRYLVDQKKTKIRLPLNCSLCADRAQNLPWPVLNNALRVLHKLFRQNRFTFCGVIAERVNTAKLPR